MLEQIANQARVGRRISLELPATLQCPANIPALDSHFVDLAILDLGDELGVLHRAGLRLPGAEIAKYRHQHDGDDEPKQEILGEIVQVFPLRRCFAVNGDSAPQAVG